MIKAILFDLDGTIANTIPALKSGINLTMRALGYPESTEDDVLAHINHGARQLIRLSLPTALQSDEEKVSEALALYNKMYALTYTETNATYEGIPEVFRELCARGYKLAVLSNKQDEFVVRLCEQLLPCCKRATGGRAYEARPHRTAGHRGGAWRGSGRVCLRRRHARGRADRQKFGHEGSCRLVGLQAARGASRSRRRRDHRPRLRSFGDLPCSVTTKPRNDKNQRKRSNRLEEAMYYIACRTRAFGACGVCRHRLRAQADE